MAIRFIQLELPLFEPPSFDEILREQDVHTLSVVTSKRFRNAWRVKILRGSRIRTLTVPMVLGGAPRPVKEALIAWAMHPIRPSVAMRSAARNKKKAYESIVWDFLREKGVLPSHERPVNPQRYSNRTKGIVYDLQDIFDKINRKYFNGDIAAIIRWGVTASTTSYQTIRRDLNAQHYNLITIAGAYNHPDVPLFAIESVVFHEMLHIRVPSYRRNGRRVMHGHEFRSVERSFPYFQKWRIWERESLRKIARSLKIRSRKKRKRFLAFW